MIGRLRELGPAVPPARARHLWRAGIGAVIMTVLMVSLLLIEDEAPVSQVAVAPQPVAVTSAPIDLPPAAPQSPAPTEPVSTEPEGAADDAVPGQRSDAIAATDERAVAPPPASAAECVPATGPALVRPAMPVQGTGFMVQLGVFGDPANADSLRAELGDQGYPAYVQSRVVLGPYASRKAAQSAHDKLRRERRIDGMIIPPRTP